MAATRTRNQFCACGHNRSLVYVGLASSMRYPMLCGVASCECTKHDTAVAEKTKVVDASDLRSDTIDRARLLDINRAQWAAIKLAKALLGKALAADAVMFKIHCEAALLVLRGLGED